MTYKLIKDIDSEKIGCVLRSDGVAIPLDEANTDYQAYLKWVAEGNTPEAAE
jgi:hypothetical protein